MALAEFADRSSLNSLVNFPLTKRPTPSFFYFSTHIRIYNTMSRIATVVKDLRNGLGAIKLRSDVKKVTLVFSGKSDNSGARYYYFTHTTLRWKHQEPTAKGGRQEPDVDEERKEGGGRGKS